jgi:hypothetical protein
MQITYELTLKDFKEAYADHRNGKALTKWAVRLFTVMLVVMAAVTVFGFVLKSFTEAARMATPLLILIAFYVAVLWVFPSWSLKLQFRRQPGAQGPRTLTLDDTGVHWRWSGGVSDIEWKNYIRALEGKNQILFYTSPAAFNMLPKRALTDEQLAEVRQLLTQHIPATK